MKFHIPLYARIAGWFLLNILLIGVIVGVFTRQYFSLDNLIAGPAGDRITTLAKLTGENLRSHNETDWPDLLASLEEQHQLSFFVLRNDGNPLTGSNFSPPESVLSRLTEFEPPIHRPQGPGKAPGKGPANGRDGTKRGPGPPAKPFGFEAGADFARPGPPAERGPGRRHGSQEGSQENDQEDDLDDTMPVHARLLFAVQDEHGDYWFVNRIGLGRPGGGNRRPPSVLLLIKSPTLGANGLILDTGPWWRLGAAIVAISIVLWVPFAWSITRYIRRLTRRTISIARGNFEANDISHRGDELGRLGMAIDRLRQRLRGYVDGQKRFTSDIAHELCTPLARMQLSLGVLEQQTQASPETINDLRDEVQQMSSMVDELLDFSRASISPDQVALESVDLAELAREVVDREGATTASVDIQRNTRAKANPHLLRRALGNVVRNAMLHAPGTEILIHTSTSGDSLEILVDDNGPGIPDQDLPRIFEPFYRVDGARTREDGGTGLGLAIVSTCMEGCGGTASCENLRQGGLRVILTLPLA